MKCKWCGTEVYLWRDRELGGGMIIEDETGENHSCQPFLEWEKSKNLHGPTLSISRYELWRLGPKKAEKRIDLQKKANEPLLPRSFFKTAHVVEATPAMIDKKEAS